MATANPGSSNVSILLGNGDGTFQAAANYPVGANPNSIAVGDFNGDVAFDLVVTNQASNTISVLLGNGNGTFQVAVNYSVGPQPASVAVGDFNGDGKPDLAVTNQGSNTISILLGNGDGTFQAAVNYSVGSGPISVAVGDFNADGRPDLAVAVYNSSYVYLLLGNGDGTFQLGGTIGAGANPYSVAVGDFNGDGRPDLAVANLGSNNVSVLFGNGNGTFQAPVNYSAGSQPVSVAVGDFNGDGRPDLAVANQSSNDVSILLGNSDGTFLAPDNYGAGTTPFSVTVADFNGDGRSDLAVANPGSGNVSILLGVRTGLLRVTTSSGVPTQILLDGQIADTWGLTWLKLAPGPHTVCFTHVEGWTEPPCQTVTMTGGSTTTVTGTFTQRGWLRVISSPAVPSQITVDGHPTDDWGMWTDIATGSHTVCFGAVAGYDPPACQAAVVNAGALTMVTGAFTTNPSAVGQSGVGMLRVASSPAVPSQITIQSFGGSPYIADTWALNWLELPPGNYRVSFSHVLGFSEPPPQTISITAGNITVVPANFTQRGTLRVVTSPAAAATITVDGIPRNDWGIWTDIPAGSHNVCFGSAIGYANTPACQTASIAPGAETDITATYH